MNKEQLEPFIKEGYFTLTSGGKSKVYVDVKEAMGYPNIMHEMVMELHKKHSMKNIDVIIGLEYGGIPIAVALSQYTSVPFAVLRKEKKKFGTEERLEGFRKLGLNRVLLLDDVRNTGGTMKEAKNYLKSRGYKIIATDVVFKRSELHG